MSEIEKKSKNKNIRYILLLLLLLLISLGIWICPNQPENKTKVVLTPEKEVTVKADELAKTERITEEDKSPQVSSEPSIPKSKDKPTTSKSKEEIVKEVKPMLKKEEPSALEGNEPSKSEKIISVNEFPKEEIVVYSANKQIDKRSPASSDLSCKATTKIKIAKASIQTSVAISPDGNKFAVGNHNNYVTVLNMEGKELLKLIGHNSYVQSIKYSPDGKFLVTGSVDNTGKLWDATNGKEIKRLEGHTEGILSVAYSPNGKYIATGSLDHTTILWDAKSGKKLFQLGGHKLEIAEVAFSMNSKFLITGSSDQTAKVWDVETGKILYSLEGHDGVVGGVAFTPDGKLIATGSADKIRLWNAKTGKHIHTINEKNAQIMSIYISNDGEYISSSNRSGLIKIWKVKGGKPVCEYQGHSTRAREAVFHPKKKNTVISAGNDSTIRIWEFEW